MGSIVSLLLFQVVLIALNAIFASAEIAVLSINEAKLERMANEGNAKAKRLFRLTQEPAKFLATIQVAITLSGFLGSAFAADNFSEPLVAFVLGLGVDLPPATLDAIAVVLITLVLSYFTLIFGELVPKRLAMKKSEQIAMAISGLVSGIALLFRPVVSFLSFSTNIMLRLCGVDPNEAEDDVSEEEIRMLVDAGSEKGTIDHQEKEFIENVFEFNDITAGDVAIHRTDVTILWLEDTVDIWEETIHEKRYTRYPLCDGSPDRVIGILDAKDFFRLREKTRENVLAEAVHPAYFVPEILKADVLFRQMRQDRQGLAVVLDEYGGMVGIATLLDLVEELVGDLNSAQSDTDAPEPTIEQRDSVTWQIVGNVELDALEEATGLRLVHGDYDTFTGFVFDALGAVPADGTDRITLDLENALIEIDKIANHQVAQATIRLKTQKTE